MGSAQGFWLPDMYHNLRNTNLVHPELRPVSFYFLGLEKEFPSLEACRVKVEGSSLHFCVLFEDKKGERTLLGK